MPKMNNNKGTEIKMFKEIIEKMEVFQLQEY
jgi:hypothetical protein